MIEIIRYFFDSSNNLNQNILNKKILEIIKNNNMIGGDNESRNFIIIIIAIIFIVIGFILYFYKNDWSSTNAIIKNITSVSSLNSKINIIYSVNLIEYSKTIIIPNSNLSKEPIIQIYYQNSNPNIIRFNNYSYSIIGIFLIILGLLILISNYIVIQ
jgi:uncharacterized membrane protein